MIIHPLLHVGQAGIVFSVLVTTIQKICVQARKSPEKDHKMDLRTGKLQERVREMDLFSLEKRRLR